MSAEEWSLVLSCLAIIVSCLAGVAAVRSAQAARRSADAAEASNQRETARDLERRRPRVEIDLVDGDGEDSRLRVRNDGAINITSFAVELIGADDEVGGSAFTFRGTPMEPMYHFAGLRPGEVKYADIALRPDRPVEHVRLMCWAETVDDSWEFQERLPPPYNILDSVW